MYQRDDSDKYNLYDYNNTKRTNKIKVIGKGTLSVKPDLAEVIVGVTTENTQLEAAQEENARITQQVISSLKGIGVLPKYIQTQSYNVRPAYDYVDGKQVFRSYEVSNSLKVLIRNINLAGEIIDMAVQNGANIISGINFIVSDEINHYYEALRLAVEDAQNKATVIANKLKVNLNTIPIQVNEQERGSIAPLTVMSLKAVGGSTPIEAGENKITADIEAVFIYAE